MKDRATRNPDHSSAPSPRLRLRLNAAAESSVRGGHLWVFAESIREQNRPGKLGELAIIYNRNDKFLAIGLYDPDSPIRVRVLHQGRPQTLDDAWWKARLEQTISRRDGLFDEQTNGYRWTHGESDGWPGLVLDRYDTTLVLKLYTAVWLPRLDQLVQIIRNRLVPEAIVLRLSRNTQQLAESHFARSDGALLFASESSAAQNIEQGVRFNETGIRFEADVIRGQKTGFFLDQRENRRRVETLARGRRVLNAFSFSGGFSLYAARGAASSVTDVDISPHALESSRRNFALNRDKVAISRCRHDLVQADVFDYLGEETRKFDLVILDPPSLAKRAAERAGALRAYARLVKLGLARLSPGGILVACSCSAQVSADEFFNVVRTAGGGKLREIETTFHPPDHPASFKESHYLKGIYAELTGRPRA